MATLLHVAVNLHMHASNGIGSARWTWWVPYAAQKFAMQDGSQSHDCIDDCSTEVIDATDVRPA